MNLACPFIWHAYTSHTQFASLAESLSLEQILSPPPRLTQRVFLWYGISGCTRASRFRTLARAFVRHALLAQSKSLQISNQWPFHRSWKTDSYGASSGPGTHGDAPSVLVNALHLWTFADIDCHKARQKWMLFIVIYCDVARVFTGCK